MEGAASFVFIVATVSARHLYKRYHKPILFFRPSPANIKRVKGCSSLTKYEPPILLDYYGHVHSAVCHLLRGLFQVELTIDRELLTLSDGGTVGLDWVDLKPKSSSTTPLVILFHGICGNSSDSHVVYAARRLRKAGFNVVTLISRGCGGVPLTTPASFNAARRLDLQEGIAHISKCCPQASLFGAGYSLGAGMLLNYVGHMGDSSLLKRALAVSPSWDFHKETHCFYWWSHYRLKDGLYKYSVIDNGEYLLNNPGNIDMDAVKIAQNVRQFDHAAVVPVMGYADVDEYYTESSACRVSANITTPTVALSSLDDPVCSAEGCPTSQEQLGPGLVVVQTKKGGHVSFMSGLLSTSRGWMDDVAVEWFSHEEEIGK